jgi:hypothetical protein
MCPHTTSGTPSTCDISLDTQTYPAPEAGDFVELILVYVDSTFMLPSHFQCEYQNNREKLRLYPFIHTSIHPDQVSFFLQENVGTVVLPILKDNFCSRDFFLLNYNVPAHTAASLYKCLNTQKNVQLFITPSLYIYIYIYIYRPIELILNKKDVKCLPFVSSIFSKSVLKGFDRTVHNALVRSK